MPSVLRCTQVIYNGTLYFVPVLDYFFLKLHNFLGLVTVTTGGVYKCHGKIKRTLPNYGRCLW